LSAGAETSSIYLQAIADICQGTEVAVATRRPPVSIAAGISNRRPGDDSQQVSQPAEVFVMEMTMFALGVVIVVLLIDAWIAYSVSRSQKTAATKLGWIVLVFALPVVGWIIWGLYGPRGIVKGPTSQEHSKG
jgi:hypothetical protein